jgi:hypothetical protein
MYVPRARGFCPYKGATRPTAWVGVGERGERGERVSACVGERGRARTSTSVRQHGKERAERKRERAERRPPKHHQHKLKKEPTDRLADRLADRPADKDQGQSCEGVERSKKLSSDTRKMT